MSRNPTVYTHFAHLALEVVVEASRVGTGGCQRCWRADSVGMLDMLLDRTAPVVAAPVEVASEVSVGLSMVVGHLISDMVGSGFDSAVIVVAVVVMEVVVNWVPVPKGCCAPYWRSG